MRLKGSSAKWRSFGLGLIVLNITCMIKVLDMGRHCYKEVRLYAFMIQKSENSVMNSAALSNTVNFLPNIQNRHPLLAHREGEM